MAAPVRLGVLGAGAIAKYGLFAPISRVGAIEVVAVGARDAARAGEYARENGIPRGDTYQGLLDDPSIEAVYNALPNALHCEWTVKALEAGKAVLCEKPFASNEAEARIMAEAAQRTGGILVEAVHWLYHPQSPRMKQLLDDGAIGALREINFSFLVPGKYFTADDIRFSPALAGGATMDLGYYAISFLRYVGGEPEITSAAASEFRPGIDGAMKAEMRFPGGAVGRMDLSLDYDADDFIIAAEIIGERGRMILENPVHPSRGGGIVMEVDGARTVEAPHKRATYDWQALGFAANVREGTPILTPADEGIANMRVIDAVYRAAGMKPRGT
ncbi:MAG: Gfo/Idh/MocA family protein [Sphingomonadales bacterium]